MIRRKMKRLLVNLFWLPLLLILGACASQQYDLVENQNYSVGIEKTAAVGAVMIMKERIVWVEQKRWVGVLYSSDGWDRSRYATDESFREELIYTGRTGVTVTITYREYKKEFARPAFYQNLTYDVSQSQEVVFRNYRLKLLAADNAGIKFIVISD